MVPGAGTALFGLVPGVCRVGSAMSLKAPALSREVSHGLLPGLGLEPQADGNAVPGRGAERPFPLGDHGCRPGPELTLEPFVSLTSSEELWLTWNTSSLG